MDQNGKLKDAIDRTLFFDIKDLSQSLKVSERHITNLRARGEIPQPIKLGTRVLWPKAAFLNWIEAGCPAISAYTG